MHRNEEEVINETLGLVPTTVRIPAENLADRYIVELLALRSSMLTNRPYRPGSFASPEKTERTIELNKLIQLILYIRNAPDKVADDPTFKNDLAFMAGFLTLQAIQTATFGSKTIFGPGSNLGNLLDGISKEIIPQYSGSYKSIVTAPGASLIKDTSLGFKVDKMFTLIQSKIQKDNPKLLKIFNDVKSLYDSGKITDQSDIAQLKSLLVGLVALSYQKDIKDTQIVNLLRFHYYGMQLSKNLFESASGAKLLYPLLIAEFPKDNWPEKVTKSTPQPLIDVSVLDFGQAKQPSSPKPKSP